MDEAVMAYYRKLTGMGFENVGSLEDASIFLENFADFSLSCHGNADDFMRIYIHVVDNVVSEIKYQCICDPTTNVAVEILCTLIKRKTLEEAATLKENAFSQFLGSEDTTLQERAKDLLELLNSGILRYKADRTE